MNRQRSGGALISLFLGVSLNSLCLCGEGFLRHFTTEAQSATATRCV